MAVRIRLNGVAPVRAVLGETGSVKASAGVIGGVPAGWSVWSATEAYQPLEKVSHNGSSYVCIKANTGIDPEADVNGGVEGEYWLLIAKKGDTGQPGQKGEPGERGEAFEYEDFTPEQLEGLRGPKGEPGVQGEAFEYEDFTTEQLNELVIAPSWEIGSVETLEPDQPATASLGGDRANPVLTLGIPKGRSGADGYGGAVVNGKTLELTEAGEAENIPIATTTTLGGVIVGDNLTVDENGRISVDTADAPEEDNTRPITSAAVQTSIGNIEVLLGTI